MNAPAVAQRPVHLVGGDVEDTKAGALGLGQPAPMLEGSF